MAYTVQERLDYILSQVLDRGHVTVRGLAEELAASQATVRRDLRVLAGQGELELVYGGASRPRTRDFSFRSKAKRNVEAKRIIGRLAAELVGDGEQVFLDSGTTSFELALRLKGKHGLSIIVNSARLAIELDRPGLNVILLGGQYRPDRMDTIGPLATAALDQLRGYIAFIGADGLNMQFGLAANDIESADLYRRAVHNARKTVLVVDHTKFVTPSLFKIVGFEAVAQVVTDRRPPAEWGAFFADLGIEVIHPPAEDAEADGGRARENAP